MGKFAENKNANKEENSEQKKFNHDIHLLSNELQGKSKNKKQENKTEERLKGYLA